MQETMPSCTVAELLVDYLVAEGVTAVFGIPGGAAVWLMGVLQKRAKEIKFVITRHESGAGYIADGYARATGGLGVVVTTSGPGATNALTAAVNAQASNVSLLVVTGEVPEKYFGRGYLQEGTAAKLNVNAIYQNAVESSALVASPSCFPALFQHALRSARSLPNRAAHINLPNDVGGATIAAPVRPNPASYHTSTACADPPALQATLDDLLSARRPLIFLGNGSRAALADPARLRAFSAFVERCAIPVMTTPDAKGIFPESHPLSLRNYGMCGAAWPALYMKPVGDPDHFDALLVLGSTLGQLATMASHTNLYDETLVPAGPFIQVDLDTAAIGRCFPITRGVVGEIGASLDVITAQAQAGAVDEKGAAERRAAVAALKKSREAWADPEARASSGAPVHPAALLGVVSDVVREGDIFIDAGNCVGWSLNNLVIDPPVRYQSALIMGPMGFATCAAIGAKLGRPDRASVAVVGDGAFLMHGAEVSTAAEHRIGAVWVVLDDNDMAMVSQGMDVLMPPLGPWKESYRLGGPDLELVARGLGAAAVTVRRNEGPEVARAALERALVAAAETGQPQVVVVQIDPVPMPPYGWPKLS